MADTGYFDNFINAVNQAETLDDLFDFALYGFRVMEMVPDPIMATYPAMVALVSAKHCAANGGVTFENMKTRMVKSFEEDKQKYIKEVENGREVQEAGAE